MHPAGGLGDGHTLYPVHSPLVFQSTERPPASYFKDDFLEAADTTLIHADNIYVPAFSLGVATVHPEQVSGKERGFITTRPGADFDDDVFLIIGVPG